MFKIQNAKTLDLINSDGVKIKSRLVKKGDAYGKNMCLINIGQDLIEFYDSSYPFEYDENGKILGQFISRYYAKSIKNIEPGRGINLEGGVKSWSINGRNVVAVKKAFC